MSKVAGGGGGGGGGSWRSNLVLGLDNFYWDDFYWAIFIGRQC